MTTPDPIHALRTTHDQLAALLSGLTPDQVAQQSYDDEWTIADVASHLGSGAEIFTAMATAVIAGEEPPGNDGFPAIWDRWNATPPAEQVTRSIRADEHLVGLLEGLDAAQAAAFTMDLFGMSADLDRFASMRLGEQALHTWDVAVALDPTAVLAADAVAVLVTSLPSTLGRLAKPVEGGGIVTVHTTDPVTEFTLDLATPSLLDEQPKEAHASATMPAEAFVRLAFGRLDPDHTPAGTDGDEATLTSLRALFPGV